MERRNQGRGHGRAPEADCGWARRHRGEPPLEELLADPIMTLLWHSEGLDPGLGRVRVEALRALALVRR